MPLISIIIPTYNSEFLLGNTLNSILTQTFTDFEVIIIDGASNDGTLEIASSFENSRISIYSEKDSGIYDAMNKGIGFAKGGWLFFLGSDDELYDDEVLSDMFKIISNTKDKVIYGNVILNGDTGWGRNGQIYDGEFDLKKLLDVNISHQAIFYHSDVFPKCGVYNLRYKICADYDYNLRVASKFRLHYINRIITKFNAGGTSSYVDDIDFTHDFYKNIIQYFLKSLYKNRFKNIEFHIIRQGKIDLQNFKFIRGIYLSGIGYKFKIIRHLYNRLSL